MARATLIKHYANDRSEMVHLEEKVKIMVMKARRLVVTIIKVAASCIIRC